MQTSRGIFKAKRITHHGKIKPKAWVDGAYTPACATGSYPRNPHLNDDKTYPAIYAKHYFGFIPVDPTTICESTGLYDATKWDELTDDEKRAWLRPHFLIERRAEDWLGKLIFENDLLRWTPPDDPSVYTHGSVNSDQNVVRWMRGGFVIATENDVLPIGDEVQASDGFGNGPADKLVEWKVIGNIYD